jgi:hypothetical protein
MPWCGPTERKPFPSLGWLFLYWSYDNLPSPRDHSEPLTFTPEQAAGLVEWFGVDIETGQRFVYRRGCSRRAKGWGKSPREAAKAIGALAADVVPDGFDADGEPVGRPWGTGGLPHAWVQIAAVSEDQTDNTYSVLHELLTANDGKAADELRIDVGLTRCLLRDRPGKLEPVTASAGSREGQPVTDAVLDETHLWTPQNGGVKLARTLRRNVAKMGGRSYETTNAFVPGEESVAEATHKAVELGAAGIYYDAVEAPPVKEEDPDEKLREALKIAYGDSWWVNLERLLQDIRDPDTPWEDSSRFFFNWNVDDRRKAVDQKRWSELVKRVTVDDVPAGARIGLGFDGSISDDCTVLIGTVEIDGVPHGFDIEIWKRPPNAPRGWRIPRADVQKRVREAFEFWDVGLMMCDPAKWQTEIEGWSEEFGDDRVVFFDTNHVRRMAGACDRFLTALAEGAYSHDGTDEFTRQVLAMHKRKVRVRDDDDDGRTKFVFVKGPDKLKIDAGIGAVLALEAFATMPEPQLVAGMVAWG